MTNVNTTGYDDMANSSDESVIVGIVGPQADDPSNAPSTNCLEDYAFAGDIDTVRVLLEAGADVNGTTNHGDWNPLHAAVENCQVEVIKLLIQFGADVNLPYLHVFTPLHHAIDVEIDGATQSESPDDPEPVITRLLVESGADTDAIYFGETALQMAIHRGHHKAASYLCGKAAQ